MAQFVAAVVLYFQSVIRHVSAYITGGLIAALVFIYEHSAGKNIPMDALIWGIAAFFVVGSFLTWKEQWQKVKKLEELLADRKNREEKQITISFFIKQSAALRKRLREEPDEKQVTADIVDWQLRTEQYLAANFNETFLVRFGDPTGIPDIHPIEGTPKERFRVWGNIKTRTWRLHEFLKELN